ncbi:MAG: hypothetical protein LCH84_16490 [Gemmatimonadetes bacterium]|nr:hypothetical protein [Gemmatimonadota bacterium]
MSRRSLAGALALVAFAIALVVALRWFAAPRIAPDERTVAVLAFTVGAPPQRDARGDSLRDAVVRELARVSGLTLVGEARPLDTAMLALRPREVGATVGARLVVAGTRDAAGRTTVRLIEVEMGDLLHADSVAPNEAPDAAAARLAAAVARALGLPPAGG